MPNCFTLTRKIDIGAGPVAFNKIDEELCAHLNVPCDKEKYHAMWYDLIGFRVACGQALDSIINQFKSKAQAAENMNQPDNAKYWRYLVEIAEWLNENFTTDAWVEIGKR